MKLTGKTKEVFIEYIYTLYRYTEITFNNLIDSFKNSLIIEFFDSVGIYISINYVDIHTDLISEKGFKSLVSHKNISTMFRVVQSRQEATDKAIEKANEILNNKLA